MPTIPFGKMIFKEFDPVLLRSRFPILYIGDDELYKCSLLAKGNV